MQDPIKCSNGTYRDTEGAGSDMDCIDCALGQYCLSEGLTEPTGPCQPGFYCLRGNVEPTPTGTIIDLEFHYGFEVWQNVLYYDPDIILFTTALITLHVSSHHWIHNPHYKCTAVGLC